MAGSSAYYLTGEVVRSCSVGRQKDAPVFLFQLKNKKGDSKKLSRFCGLLRPALRRALRLPLRVSRRGSTTGVRHPLAAVAFS